MTSRAPRRPFPKPANLLGGLAAVVAITLLSTQTVAAEGLVDVYRKALAADGRFAAAVGSHAAGVEKYYQGRSQLLPTLSLSTERSSYNSGIEYEGSTTFESGNRKYKERKSAATLTQPLFHLESYAAYQQGKAQADSADAQFAQAKEDLIIRVAQAYFDLLTAQQVLEAATSYHAAMKGKYEQARLQFKAGSSSRLETSEAKARMDVARAQQIAASSDVVNKQHALRRITGEMPQSLAALGPAFPYISPTPTDPEQWAKVATEASPQLRGLRSNVTAAEYEVLRAEGGHFPTLDFVAEYSKDYATGSVYTSATSDTQIKSATVRLQMPLFQGWGVNSRVREAAALLEKAKGELLDGQRDVTSQVMQYFNATLSSIDQIRALEEALVSSKEAAHANRVGFEVGTSDFVEVLNAEQQVYEVTRDLTKARHEYVMNLLKLKATAGQLTEEHLVELDRYLASTP
jgi:outer membrane protein